MVKFKKFYIFCDPFYVSSMLVVSDISEDVVDFSLILMTYLVIYGLVGSSMLKMD